MGKLNKAMLITIFTSVSCTAFAWEKSVEKDKMTDQKFVQFAKSSKRAVWSTKKASLIVLINCSKAKYNLLISHPWIVGNGPVKIRLDKGDPFGSYAKKSSDSKILLVGDDSATVENIKWLIDKISSHKNMLVHYEEAGGKTVEAEFVVSGLDRKLKTACK